MQRKAKETNQTAPDWVPGVRARRTQTKRRLGLELDNAAVPEPVPNDKRIKVRASVAPSPIDRMVARQARIRKKSAPHVDEAPQGISSPTDTNKYGAEEEEEAEDNESWQEEEEDEEGRDLDATQVDDDAGEEGDEEGDASGDDPPWFATADDELQWFEDNADQDVEDVDENASEVNDDVYQLVRGRRAGVRLAP